MVLSNTSNGNLGWKKWFITGWALTECLLFSGILFGWGSLSFVLKMEGIYSDLCEDKVVNNITDVTPRFTFATMLNTESTNTPRPNDDYQKPCKPQDDKMALCFTIASAMFGTGSLLFGFINVRFGTRITRLISFGVFEFGTLSMCFVSKDNPWLMFPGLAFISVAGLSIMTTNMQVAYLFNVGSSSVVGLLNGTFNSSAAVMLFLKIAHEYGFVRQTFFIVIAACHVLVLISSVFFLPKYFIVKVLSGTDQNAAVVEHDINRVVQIQKDIPSLKSCLFHLKFLTNVFWMSILNLRFIYFIGTLNQYLTRLLHAEGQVSFFTTVCYYTMMSGIVGSYMSGALFDWQKRKCKDGKSPLYRELMPAVLPLVLTSFLALLFSILVLIPKMELLYAIFIIMTVFSVFLYSTSAAFLRNTFPSQYFGFLYGMVQFLAAIFGLLQYAIFTWSEAYDDGHVHADTFLLCLTLLTFAHPLYWWNICRRDEKRFETSP